MNNYNLNKYKIIRQIKWLIAKIWFPFFKMQYIFCNKFIKNKKKKRFFTTTGNISLINCLAIINEVGNFDKYDDYLFVDTGKGREKFIEKTLEIAKLHSFKKIVFSVGIRLETEIILSSIININEIYLLNHPEHIIPFFKIYNNTPITLIDEGAGSLINYNSDKIQNLEKFKTHKYLGKIDFYGLDNLEKIKFENIDINEFKKIANELSSKYPIQYELQPEDKVILYCGIYWEVTGLSREKFIEAQSRMLNDLLEKGYKILYKPHPRDNEFFGFDKHPNVIFIDSKLPIELYNLDVVAIVSVSSTTSITPAHYWDIPSFSNVIDESISKKENSVNINVIRFIIKEYSPNYKELLKLDVKNTSKDELKKQIKEKYISFLKDKPLLSENKKVKDYAEKYGM